MKRDARILVGDSLEVLRTLPAESAHCVVSSPPYWGLRDYGVEGQLGLEETPDDWCARLVEVFREVRRVLRKDGTLWLNCGDSYCGSPPGNDQPDHSGDTKLGTRGIQGSSRRAQRVGNGYRAAGLKPKDLIGQPWLLAFALRADGWWLRSEIIWHKPNPMPESVDDRPTKSHEQVFLLSKSERYYYDAEAIREQGTGRAPGNKNPDAGFAADPTRFRTRSNLGSPRTATLARNARTVWTIPTQPFAEAHFATFPEELARRCIAAGTSEHGCCAECGAPWERVVDVGYENPGNRTTNGPRSTDRRFETAGFSQRLERRTQTTGWRPTCAHTAATIPGAVLDPFAGAGTTGVVALRLVRSFLGIELNPSYAEMARKRIAADAPLFNAAVVTP